MEQQEIILMIGSNHNQGENIANAQNALQALFGNIHFTECMWTEPIGIDSVLFLNCAARATTNMSVDETVRQLKAIEQEAGSTAELRKQGIIDMDIDLLLYGKEKLHEDDWDREYVKELVGMLGVRC
jgi:2-amino-4-hydroxy-6-hydroxymethyldihydropteridine diphosphokinase